MPQPIKNPYYVGKEHLTGEMNNVKHPGALKTMARIGDNKAADSMLDFIGLDIESNSETGEPYLFGTYNSGEYKSLSLFLMTQEQQLNSLFLEVRNASMDGKSYAYWNQFDGLMLFRMIASAMTEQEQQDAADRFGKVGGEWDKENQSWTIPPVAWANTTKGQVGIMMVIRTSVQLYVFPYDEEQPYTVWAYDVAGLYNGSLEQMAESKGLAWYSKLNDEAERLGVPSPHIIDWGLFQENKDYKNLALQSNELDARAAKVLGEEVLKDFHGAFGFYPKTIISQGSLARAALIEMQKEKEADIEGELSFISIMDEWHDTEKEKGTPEYATGAYTMAVEAYSAGYIDPPAFGYAEKGGYADIASAYPGIIKQLYSLKGSTIEYGQGEPPDQEEGQYIFIRGIIDVPDDVRYNPVTAQVKNITFRGTGEYIASYTWDEREYLKWQGATFEDEEYYIIQTTGKLSPLAETCQNCLDLRQELIAKKDPAEWMAKTVANSLYGILFEATPLHEWNEKEGQPEKVGFRGGECWNPVLAAIITARTRIILAQAATEIERNGGECMVLMTDSITWAGDASMLPDTFPTPFGYNGWKKEKTVGYFEEPDNIKEVLALGAGRYQFIDKKGNLEVKKRGLLINMNAYGEVSGGAERAAAEEEQAEEMTKNDNFQTFNWWQILNQTENGIDIQEQKVTIPISPIVTPGLILARPNSYSFKDLGRIDDSQSQEIGIVTGMDKKVMERIYPEEIKNDVRRLTPRLMEQAATKQNKIPSRELLDGTMLPLRELTKNKTWFSSKERAEWQKKKKKQRRKQQQPIEKIKYRLLSYSGYTKEESNKLKSQNWNKLKPLITDNAYSMYKTIDNAEDLKELG